jgi:hypothetical protein
MATTRSTGKIAPTGVRQTRKYFLKFLQATHFPPVERHGQRGKTFEYPEWLIMLIGVLAVKCQEQTYLGMHRMTYRFWNELCGRKVQLPPISENQWRARLKNIGDQRGTAPGPVVQSFPPAYLVYGCQWRYDDEQGVGTCLAHQAEGARHHPRMTAGTGHRGDLE